MNKRLTEVECRLQMIENLPPELEDLKSEILVLLYEKGHLHWLVGQAIKLEETEKVLLNQYNNAGISAERDVQLWKELESYFGGREKALKASEVSTE